MELNKMNFRSDVAKDVGTDAAIILSNIDFWCQKNRQNKKNFFDNNYWTYNTIEAFQQQFDWLSTSQIRRCLKKLEDNGYIQTGNYNKSSYDRTKWYCSLSQIELTKSSNGKDETDETIPDTKPDTKPYFSLKTENINLDEVDIEDGNTDLSIVQKIIPPKQHYLDLYNRAKKKFKGGYSYAKNLNTQDSQIKDNFEFVYSNYKVRDLKFALKGLFIQIECMDSIFTTHHIFKDNKFETYRDAGMNDVITLYSTKKKQFKQQEL